MRLILPLVTLFASLAMALPVRAENEPPREDPFSQLSAEALAAREAALERLMRTDGLTVEVVGQALGNSDPRSRPLLLELAGQKGMIDLVPQVAAATASADPGTVEAALRALVVLGPKAVAAGDIFLARRKEAGALARMRLRALDLQRTVEHAVVAKWRRKGGSYRGRYRGLEEHGWAVQPILLAMLLDVPLEARFVVLPEARDERLQTVHRQIALRALHSSPRRGYRTFDPLPVHINEDELFELAQQALRDVADVELLGEILEEVARDLLDADRLAPFQLRRFEKSMAEGIATVLYTKGRRELMEAQEAELRTKVSRARRGVRGGAASWALSQFARYARELAATLHLMEKFDDAAKWYAEVNAAQIELSGERSAIASYNRACALACAGKKEEALKQLDEALSLDTSDLSREWVDEDGDLLSLRDDPRFKAILDRRFQ